MAAQAQKTKQNNIYNVTQFTHSSVPTNEIDLGVAKRLSGGPKLEFKYEGCSLQKIKLVNWEARSLWPHLGAGPGLVSKNIKVFMVDFQKRQRS